MPCTPMILFVIFAMTHIIFDITNGLHKIALIKCIFSLFVAIGMSVLCKQDMTYVSWIIFLIPFIAMAVASLISVYVL